MKHVRLSRLLLLFVFGLFWACAGGLHLMVLYDNAKGLEADDRVLWKEQAIGKVRAVKSRPTDRIGVQLHISKNFRQEVTDLSRFLVQADPQRPGQMSVEMIRLAAGGNPLPVGSEVEGSTLLSLQFERATTGLQVWSKILEQEIESWDEELRKLPLEQWYKVLERQMEYWAGEIEQAGEETRRYFRQEVLPRLEEAVRELQRRLLELGQKKKVEILDAKLKELKRI